MSDQTIFVATNSVLAEYNGQPLYIHQGVTTVRAGHPLLDTFGGLFEPLRPMFEVDDEPEGETEAGDAASAPAGPAPKDVRAWAAGQGIEVPARGKIPAEVNEQYAAAHQEG